MSNGVRHESVSLNGVDQDVSTSQPSAQMSVVCQVVAGRRHVSTVYPDSSALPGVPVDAPLTVKQHFQQQRKQQKNRARENKRDTKKQTPLDSTAAAVSVQASALSKDENITRVTTDHQILHPARALSEPAFIHQPQSHQANPATSKSVDQEIFRNANMKVDPKLLGCFNAEDYGLMCGTVTSKDSPCVPTKVQQDREEPALEPSLRNTCLEPAMQPYDPLLRLSESKTGQKSDDVHVRNEGAHQDFIQYPSNKCDNLLSPIATTHSTDNSRLASCGSLDFPSMYSSIGGLDLPSLHSDSEMAVTNGALEQNHTDTDQTSFDQGVEKLDTETDERFLSWLYCENEHAEDDNAEYTRVLEEIEKDECYAHKIEDNQGQDFGFPTCAPSTSHVDSFGKTELEFANPLTSDSIVENYASVTPTMQQRDAVSETYTMSDFDSDLDLDVMPIREDEETLYGRLLDVLVRDIKLLTYNNAALVDEVSRLNYAIFIASEERKVLARRSCHHDRNRIRRLQTANKRKSDAQRRQQEQLTIAETQENIAQIKAKMAKTIVSSQKVQVKQNVCGASTRPTLDVAAIKRSVEAEQRALEEKITPRRATRKVGTSRFQRKKLEYSRSENKRGLSHGSAAKRGRIEAQQQEQDGGSRESSPVAFPSVHSARKATRGSASCGEAIDEQDRKRRKCDQMSSNQEDMSADGPQESDETEKYITGFAVEDQRMLMDCADAEHFSPIINDENESGRTGQSQSWRRRAGRPPARAASAAAQTLLAAELAASADAPAYSAKRTSRSRSSTNEPLSYRPPRRRVAPLSRESNQVAELHVEVPDEAVVEDDLDLDNKYEVTDEDLATLGDATGPEVVSTRMPQQLRSIRRSTRTSSRQSTGDAGDSIELEHQDHSPSHDEVSERSEGSVSMATRSHGRTSIFSSSQPERQMRERKQPAVYSPVDRCTATAQPRVVKKKS